MAEHPNDHRTAPRYSVDVPAHGSVGEQPFAGRVSDISSSGAAITGVDSAAFDNNQFVQLHMDGMGVQNGHVRRRIPEGFAVQFEDEDEDAEKRKREVQEMIRALGPGAMQG